MDLKFLGYGDANIWKDLNEGTLRQRFRVNLDDGNFEKEFDSKDSWHFKRIDTNDFLVVLEDDDGDDCAAGYRFKLVDGKIQVFGVKGITDHGRPWYGFGGGGREESEQVALKLEKEEYDFNAQGSDILEDERIQMLAFLAKHSKFGEMQTQARAMIFRHIYALEKNVQEALKSGERDKIKAAETAYQTAIKAYAAFDTTNVKLKFTNLNTGKEVEPSLKDDFSRVTNGFIDSYNPLSSTNKKNKVSSDYFANSLLIHLMQNAKVIKHITENSGIDSNPLKKDTFHNLINTAVGALLDAYGITGKDRAAMLKYYVGTTSAQGKIFGALKEKLDDKSLITDEDVQSYVINLQNKQEKQLQSSLNGLNDLFESVQTGYGTESKQFNSKYREVLKEYAKTILGFTDSSNFQWTSFATTLDGFLAAAITDDKDDKFDAKEQKDFIDMLKKQRLNTNLGKTSEATEASLVAIPSIQALLGITAAAEAKASSTDVFARPGRDNVTLLFAIDTPIEQGGGFKLGAVQIIHKDSDKNFTIKQISNFKGSNIDSLETALTAAVAIPATSTEILPILFSLKNDPATASIANEFLAKLGTSIDLSSETKVKDFIGAGLRNSGANQDLIKELYQIVVSSLDMSSITPNSRNEAKELDTITKILNQAKEAVGDEAKITELLGQINLNNNIDIRQLSNADGSLITKDSLQAFLGRINERRISLASYVASAALYGFHAQMSAQLTDRKYDGLRGDLDQVFLKTLNKLIQSQGKFEAQAITFINGKILPILADPKQQIPARITAINTVLSEELKIEIPQLITTAAPMPTTTAAPMPAPVVAAPMPAPAAVAPMPAPAAAPMPAAPSLVTPVAPSTDPILAALQKLSGYNTGIALASEAELSFINQIISQVASDNQPTKAEIKVFEKLLDKYGLFPKDENAIDAYFETLLADFEDGSNKDGTTPLALPIENITAHAHSKKATEATTKTNTIIGQINTKLRDNTILIPTTLASSTLSLDEYASLDARATEAGGKTKGIPANIYTKLEEFKKATNIDILTILDAQYNKQRKSPEYMLALQAIFKSVSKLSNNPVPAVAIGPNFNIKNLADLMGYELNNFNTSKELEKLFASSSRFNGSNLEDLQRQQYFAGRFAQPNSEIQKLVSNLDPQATDYEEQVKNIAELLHKSLSTSYTAVPGFYRVDRQGELVGSKAYQVSQQAVNEFLSGISITHDNVEGIKLTSVTPAKIDQLATLAGKAGLLVDIEGDTPQESLINYLTKERLITANSNGSYNLHPNFAKILGSNINQYLSYYNANQGDPVKYALSSADISGMNVFIQDLAGALGTNNIYDSRYRPTPKAVSAEEIADSLDSFIERLSEFSTANMGKAQQAKTKGTKQSSTSSTTSSQSTVQQRSTTQTLVPGMNPNYDMFGFSNNPSPLGWNPKDVADNWFHIPGQNEGIYRGNPRIFTEAPENWLRSFGTPGQSPTLQGFSLPQFSGDGEAEARRLNWGSDLDAAQRPPRPLTPTTPVANTK